MIHVTCNLCGQDVWQVRFPATLNGNEQLDVAAFRCTNPGYGHHAQVVECANCGLVYANPRWSEDELVAAYTAVEDNTYVEERAGRELTFQRHLRHLEQIIGPANGRSLLDIGAYIGVFVEVAAASGWDAVGVEPSAWAAEQAQKRNLNVIKGTQDVFGGNGRSFDLITMWDVIEHVSDPTNELKKASNLLKPNGWIAVHTMDSSSLTARIMGSRWPWLMDMHLYYFSQKTLANMLRNAGFEVVWSGIRGRYLSLGYLATRLSGINHPLGQTAKWIIQKLHLEDVAIPVNFGDLFTIIAQK